LAHLTMPMISITKCDSSVKYEALIRRCFVAQSVDEIIEARKRKEKKLPPSF